MPTYSALEIMRERKTEVCECCGINPAQEAHHCLYRRDLRNKTAKDLLNQTYNLQLVCYRCHGSTSRTHENKVRFWKTQCERYGKGVMLAWHNKLPYKIKVFEYL